MMLVRTSERWTFCFHRVELQHRVKILLDNISRNKAERSIYFLYTDVEKLFVTYCGIQKRHQKPSCRLERGKWNISVGQLYTTYWLLEFCSEEYWCSLVVTCLLAENTSGGCVFKIHLFWNENYVGKRTKIILTEFSKIIWYIYDFQKFVSGETVKLTDH